MNKLSQSFVLIALCIFAAGPAAGQITITSSDVGASFAPGTVINAKIDTGTHTANIGSLGATSWDFSGLTTNYSVVTAAVRPDTTQFFSLYPAATHAIGAGGGYSYFALSSSLQILGYAAGGPTPIRTKYIPPEVIEQLPMTMSTAWTATYADSSYVTVGGTTYPGGTSQVVEYSVDAYGTLTLPGGNSYQALRLKSDRHSTSNGHTLRSITYQFVTKEGATLSVVPSDTNQPQTGTISVSALSWNLPTGITSVAERSGGDAPSGFKLGQNYPNPFNPMTTIRYQLPEKSHVTLKVYDVLGSEVATLVNGVQEPGSKSILFDASSLSSGIYLYRLQAGSFIETRKLLLVR